LHERMQEQQLKARTSQEKLHQDLQKAQQEAQTLRLEASASQDQIQKLTMDKTADEKRVAQLQTRITNLERRLKDSTTANASSWTTSHATATATPDPDATTPPCIPPLGKENDSMSPARSSKCAICFKSAVGIMKKCQCGKSCGCRAHATCVNKIQAGPSVSHPGTPAPRLPVVLCGNSLAAYSKSSALEKSTMMTITPIPSLPK
jgi:hypothetical protein